MNAVERVMEILKDTGLSARKFEMSIDKTSGYLNSLTKRGSSPSVEVISKIVEVYPIYSAEWIVTGRGDMFSRHKNLNSAQELNSKYGIDVSVDEIIDKKIQTRMDELKGTLVQLIVNEIDKEIIQAKESISDGKRD